MKLINKSMLNFIFIVFSIIILSNLAKETVMAEINNISDFNLHTNNVNLMVDDKLLTNLPVNPVILNDHVLVPAREVFEQIGAVVDYKRDTREVFIGYKDSIIILTIDSKDAMVNGTIAQMSIPAKIINGKTMIPARFIAEGLRFNVNWIEQDKLVVISTDGSSDSESEDYNNIEIETQSDGNLNTSNDKYISNSIQSIEEINFPKTQIIGINTTDSTGLNYYSINSASEISKVDTFLLEDNRLVIDIYNSELVINSRTFITANPAIDEIRVGQNVFEGIDVTRVVFQLNAKQMFNVSINNDRTEIRISFEQNKLLDIDYIKQNDTEFINIEFEKLGSVDAFYLSNPDRIVIDINNISVNDEIINKQFSNIKISKFDENTLRIIYENTNNLIYNVISNDNSVKIELFKSTYSNIFYESENRRIRISKSPEYFIDINSIEHTDNYNEKAYILKFPGNYRELLGYGKYYINDNSLNLIEIQNNDENRTQLIINSNRIFAYAITEDDNNIYIDYRLPREIYPKIVILDPGHGGVDSGASRNGVIEKDIVFDIVNRTISLIETNNEIKVYSTRNTDVKIELQDRVNFSNELGDLFISVHANSAGTNEVASGTEVYYYPKDDEDVSSGMDSRTAAKIIHKNLITELQFKDRGIKTNNFYVIRNAQIPAVLAEVGFISNPEEAAKLASDEYKQKSAEAIYNSILEMFRIYSPKR